MQLKTYAFYSHLFEYCVNIIIFLVPGRHRGAPAQDGLIYGFQDDRYHTVDPSGYVRIDSRVFTEWIGGLT